MNYSQARPSIQSGDLLAFTHKGWGSWYDIKVMLVRAFTASEFSHVGLAWVVGGRIFILESVMPEVRIYPLSLLGEFYLLPLKAPWGAAAEAFALANIGAKYSQLDAILGFFKPLAKGHVNECAAYVREVLLQDGINLGALSRPDSVVAQALVQGATLTLVTPDAITGATP